MCLLLETTHACTHTTTTFAAPACPIFLAYYTGGRPACLSCPFREVVAARDARCCARCRNGLEVRARASSSGGLPRDWVPRGTGAERLRDLWGRLMGQEGVRRI